MVSFLYPFLFIPPQKLEGCHAGRSTGFRDKKLTIASLNFVYDKVYENMTVGSTR
jgi:hypothetical protein